MGHPFGTWASIDGLPVFESTADTAELHWSMVGNRAISLWHAQDGTVALWDESDALRWITAPDPEGTGIGELTVDGSTWAASRTVRTFGPTWFTVAATGADISMERTVLCPEGEVPWVLVKVTLRSVDGRPHEVRHDEVWRLRPRHAVLGTDQDARRLLAESVVSYDVTIAAGCVIATETYASGAPDVVDRAHLATIASAFGADQDTWLRRADPDAVIAMLGQPRRVVLESLGPEAAASTDGEHHPTLSLRTDVTIIPGEDTTLWCRFGRDDAVTASPEELWEQSRSALTARLPRATADVPEAREIPWHAALLTGAAARDEVTGGHTLNQGSAYSFVLGLDAATRDTLQHALPLIYSEPDLALSVLRNCVARATTAGDLPYALDSARRPLTELFQPSDQNLYALWLASEYLAATGDVDAFAHDVAYHPSYEAEAVSLTEHLCRQFDFFVHEIGLGERGHVRMRNADWNDGVVGASGVPRDVMVAKGESVLNSAFAAWVLPVWAAAAERLGRPEVAAEARLHADGLRGAVREAWNGRWFQRAYAPGADPVGDDQCWLEPQPWAILCGAADADQTAQLLDTIDRDGRSGSPLGARVLFSGNATGDVWYAINSTLVWAAARGGASWAWDEWRRMSLASHSRAYPELWEGVLSGPDSWQSPEGPAPGQTWSAPEAGISMQDFPVANAHAHAQPLLAYLRLLGVEPHVDGGLCTGQGASFRSSTFSLDADGHGQLRSAGPVTVHSTHGTKTSSGTVRW